MVWQAYLLLSTKHTRLPILFLHRPFMATACHAAHQHALSTFKTLYLAQKSCILVLPTKAVNWCNSARVFFTTDKEFFVLKEFTDMQHLRASSTVGSNRKLNIHYFINLSCTHNPFEIYSTAVSIVSNTKIKKNIYFRI